jgi:hypothetical protein
MASKTPNSYTAQPPGILGTGVGGGVRVQCKRILRGFWTMIWVPFVPFNPVPEPILDPPEPTGDVTAELLAQCEKIYERSESTRKFVEEKARATFTILSFLAPLIGAAFVFLLSQTDQASAAYHVAKWLIIVSGCLTFTAFLSIVRATAVKAHMDMLLNSVIDETSGKFKEYDAKNYVRGLLYCASWNGGLNAHVAQFVRGAHVLISLSVVLSFIASVPLGRAYADAAVKQAVEAKQNPVALQLAALHQDLVALRHDLALREPSSASHAAVAPAPGTPGTPSSNAPEQLKHSENSLPLARTKKATPATTDVSHHHVVPQG